MISVIKKNEIVTKNKVIISAIHNSEENAAIGVNHPAESLKKLYKFTVQNC